MMNATILAIANNSGGRVTLELLSDNIRTEIAKVSGGLTSLDQPLLIPKVSSVEPPSENHVVVSCGEGAARIEICLWREGSKIFAHADPNTGIESLLGFTSSDPANPKGIHLVVHPPRKDGGGWVIGDIVGA